MIAGRDYLVPVQFDPETDREAWLADRLTGHGGSDVSAIVGENPNKAPIDVWLEHTTGGSAFVDNERTIVGRALEPMVIRWFESGGELWPRSVGAIRVIKPPTVYHRDRPWMRGSADGLGYEFDAYAHLGDGIETELIKAEDLIRFRPQWLLEVKTHGWFGSRAYNLDDDGDAVISIPPDKRIQCAWYMALYDVPLTYLAALVDTHLRRTFVIQRDRELEAMLIETVDDFRRKYILTGDPPPPDGTERWRKYVSGRFKTHRPELISSSPGVDEAVMQLLVVKREQDQLKRRRELAEQVIKNHIGEAAGVITASGQVTWKSQPSGKLRDKDARAELYLVAGWTDDEIREFEDRHKQPDHRVLRTPK